jgi:hypothetical protein
MRTAPVSGPGHSRRERAVRSGLARSVRPGWLSPVLPGPGAGFSLSRPCRICLWVVVVEMLQWDYRGILAA